MIVVDSCGWIEHFGDGRRAPQYRELLSPAENLLVPTICIYEVLRWLLRFMPIEEAADMAGAMRLGYEIELTADLAAHGAYLSLQHKLPLANAVIYATARAHDATLWTHDEHLRGLPGVEWVGATE